MKKSFKNRSRRLARISHFQTFFSQTQTMFASEKFWVIAWNEEKLYLEKTQIWKIVFHIFIFKIFQHQKISSKKISDHHTKTLKFDSVCKNSEKFGQKWPFYGKEKNWKARCYRANQIQYYETSIPENLRISILANIFKSISKR